MNINPELKRHIFSALQTFIAVFGVEFFTQLGNIGNVPWGWAALGAVVLSLARVAVKVAWEAAFKSFLA